MGRSLGVRAWGGGSGERFNRRHRDSRIAVAQPLVAVGLGPLRVHHPHIISISIPAVVIAIFLGFCAAELAIWLSGDSEYKSLPAATACQAVAVNTKTGAVTTLRFQKVRVWVPRRASR